MPIRFTVLDKKKKHGLSKEFNMAVFRMAHLSHTILVVCNMYIVHSFYFNDLLAKMCSIENTLK